MIASIIGVGVVIAITVLVIYGVFYIVRLLLAFRDFRKRGSL